MKLAINAISTKVGGGRAYLQNLVREAVLIDPTIEVDVILAKSDRPELWTEHARVNYIESNVSGLISRILFEVLFLNSLAQKRCWDFLLFPNGVISPFFQNCKTIIVIQNQLIWDTETAADFGISYQRLRIWLLRLGTIRSVGKADKIIYVSNHIKQSTEAAAPNAANKSAAVIYLGLEKIIPEDSSKALPGSSPFFFYPSPFFPYKRQHIAIKAFEIFCSNQTEDQETKFVMAGHEGWTPYFRQIVNLIAKSKYRERIIVLPSQPRPIIEDLYIRAKAVLFPSICESISLILLEAMATGAPVYCANTSVMPEIAKGDILYFAKDQPDELCKLMLSSTKHSHKPINPSLKINFSWARHTTQFLILLHEGFL